MAKPLLTPGSAGPLNCPKGYGLCYGCKVWCDHPQAHTINRQGPDGSDDFAGEWLFAGSADDR